MTVQYFTGSATMNTYLVPGSPYMTFEYSGATPKFTSGQGLITSFANTTISEGGSSEYSSSTRRAAFLFAHTLIPVAHILLIVTFILFIVARVVLSAAYTLSSNRQWNGVPRHQRRGSVYYLFFGRQHILHSHSCERRRHYRRLCSLHGRSSRCEAVRGWS